MEQEKTRLLSQNSQLKRLYSLSQQGLTSPGSGGQAGGGPGGGGGVPDDTTSPRLKKKRLISNTSNQTTNITTSLENTSEMLKAEFEVAPSSGNEMYQQQQNQSSNSNSSNNQPVNNTAAPSVAELSLQLMNEQRLRMRLEERLKTLEQHAASSVTPNTTNTNVRMIS